MPPEPMPTTPCPGCGVLLPPSDWPVDARRNASPACWERYTQVLANEAASVAVLGHLHQLTVDAYAAQHPGPQVPAITVPFALIGLHLTLEEGWSGNAVRGAHQALARRFSRWPRFEAPGERGAMTAADVAAAASAHQHAELVQAWATGVWEAWEAEQPAVRSWALAVLSADLRGRLQAVDREG